MSVTSLRGALMLNTFNIDIHGICDSWGGVQGFCHMCDQWNHGMWAADWSTLVVCDECDSIRYITRRYL
jgi:hypothetical protein